MSSGLFVLPLRTMKMKSIASLLCLRRPVKWLMKRQSQKSNEPQWKGIVTRVISSLMKCTFAIRQMAYGSVPDSLDEYLKMGATTARKSLENFCNFIMNLYEEQHRDDDPVRTDEESMQVTQEIVDRTGQLSLKADLVEYI
nr:putative harbinger transposase-derived protein [Tanacetum cinerariifolium]